MKEILALSIFILFLTHAAVTSGGKPEGKEKLQSFISEIIREVIPLFKERIKSGSQFSILVIVPTNVQKPEDIKPYMDRKYEGINYQFAVPTKFTNGNFPEENCRTHAEIITMKGTPDKPSSPQQLYQNFKDKHGDGQASYAFLYTWIHPCLNCTDEIIKIFGCTKDIKPVWDLDTYIARTTAGTLITPELSESDRKKIKKKHEEANLPLLEIKVRQQINSN